MGAHFDVLKNAVVFAMLLRIDAGWLPMILVNKRELSELLGVTLPTLDKWLRCWPDFPIAERGGPGSPFRFDPEASRDFVAAKRADRDSAKAERAARLRQFSLPLLADGDAAMIEPGPRSAADLLTLARLRRLQREEAIAAGRLVDARRLAELLSEVFGRLGRDQRHSVRRVLRDRGVEAGIIADIEAAFAEAQRAAVAAVATAIDTRMAPEPTDDALPALRLAAG